MNNPEQRRPLTEAIEEHDSEQDRLFRLVAALANCLDRQVVIETMQQILGVTAVDEGDCVIFGNITVTFDQNGRVKGLYRVIDGSERAPGVTGE